MDGVPRMQRMFGSGRWDLEGALRASIANLIPLLTLFALDRLDLAVYASFGAFTALYGRGEPYRVRVRTLAVAALGFATVLTSAILLAASSAGLWATAIVLIAVVIAAISLSELMAWIPRGALFFVFALLVPASIPIDPARVHEPLIVMAASIAFAVALGLSGWLVRARGPRGLVARLPELRRRPTLAFAPLRAHTHAILVAVNVIGIAAAWLLPLAWGIGHPYWAAVTVAAVLPSIASLTRFNRMLQRLVGTIAGALVAAALFLWQPPDLMMIVMIAVCAFAAELLVGRNYGVALLFITPLALGASNLSVQRAWLPLLGDRIIETAFGAAVALVIIVVSRAVLARARPDSTTTA